ncbi:MAG TPA: hypothetical protein VF191_04325, partial [Cyclobacteriaceae bacterium]
MTSGRIEKTAATIFFNVGANITPTAYAFAQRYSIRGCDPIKAELSFVPGGMGLTAGTLPKNGLNGQPCRTKHDH